MRDFDFAANTYGLGSKQGAPIDDPVAFESSTPEMPQDDFDYSLGLEKTDRLNPLRKAGRRRANEKTPEFQRFMQTHVQ